MPEDLMQTAPKFRCTRMSPFGLDLYLDECERNRERPRHGQKITLKEIHELRLKGIDPSITMPACCEHCKDWPKLTAQLNGQKERWKDMALTDKEWVRTAVVLQKAESIRAAAAELGIGHTTLSYRISQRHELQKIVAERGLIQDKHRPRGCKPLVDQKQEQAGGDPGRELETKQPKTETKAPEPETKMPSNDSAKQEAVSLISKSEGLDLSKHTDIEFGTSQFIPGKVQELTTAPSVNVTISISGMSIDHLFDMLSAIPGDDMRQRPVSGIKTRAAI